MLSRFNNFMYDLNRAGIASSSTLSSTDDLEELEELENENYIALANFNIINEHNYATYYKIQ